MTLKTTQSEEVQVVSSSKKFSSKSPDGLVTMLQSSGKSDSKIAPAPSALGEEPATSVKSKKKSIKKEKSMKRREKKGGDDATVETTNTKDTISSKKEKKLTRQKSGKMSSGKSKEKLKKSKSTSSVKGDAAADKPEKKVKKSRSSSSKIALEGASPSPEEELKSAFAAAKEKFEAKKQKDEKEKSKGGKGSSSFQGLLEATEKAEKARDASMEKTPKQPKEENAKPFKERPAFKRKESVNSLAASSHHKSDEEEEDIEHDLFSDTENDNDDADSFCGCDSDNKKEKKKKKKEPEGSKEERKKALFSKFSSFSASTAASTDDGESSSSTGENPFLSSTSKSEDALGKDLSSNPFLSKASSSLLAEKAKNSQSEPNISLEGDDNAGPSSKIKQKRTKSTSNIDLEDKDDDDEIAKDKEIDRESVSPPRPVALPDGMTMDDISLYDSDSSDEDLDDEGVDKNPEDQRRGRSNTKRKNEAMLSFRAAMLKAAHEQETEGEQQERGNFTRNRSMSDSEDSNMSSGPRRTGSKRGGLTRSKSMDSDGDDNENMMAPRRTGSKKKLQQQEQAGSKKKLASETPEASAAPKKAKKKLMNFSQKGAATGEAGTGMRRAGSAANLLACAVGADFEAPPKRQVVRRKSAGDGRYIPKFRMPSCAGYREDRNERIVKLGQANNPFLEGYKGPSSPSNHNKKGLLASLTSQYTNEGKRNRKPPSTIECEQTEIATELSSVCDASISTAGGDPAFGGMEFKFSLPVAAMKDVDTCLIGIHNIGKLVRQVSTNGKGSVFLYGDAGAAFTPDIPEALYTRLSNLRNASFKRRPAYISLGDRDRYFCGFHDGTYAMKGPKGLEKELQGTKKQPVSVAFGSTYETFIVVFADGTWKCGGRGVPVEFVSKLGSRRDVKSANLGPNGEWFLKLHNEKMCWGGINPDLDRAIEDVLRMGHQISFLDFGDDGSYIVSYE